MSLVDDKPPALLDRHPLLKATLGTPGNAAITLALAILAGLLLPRAWDWFIWNAVWWGSAEDCTAASGACWAFIGEKLQFIVTGLYPPEQSYRAYAACGLLFGLLLVSTSPRLWGRGLLALWIAGIGGAIWLLGGGGPLVPVATDKWGGLPVTLFLSISAFLLAFPLAVGLALARRSRLGGLRLYAVTFIELVRGVPFIAILYAATLLFPLMLPEGAAIDKFARATVALSLFVAAYLAEIIRAGLQAIPNGQYEAAQSLGLTWWQATRLVVLPQALKTVIPAIINLAIGIFQDTTLVAVIGMFDLLNAARVAANDQVWLGFYTEAYVFVALLYFLFCFSSARYSLWLERHLNPVRRH
ncbi:amino acid ABC transporter permease [Oryzibacter oryziterrae]|uniref:amino acid ABC transporter permease n=1 Tax=Oryzibacter oryziterrae TaxID=2766474 RepID=UPI001F22CAFB|nr:amino acid ABC transporter permease [Oryzibacter oryziterrae]